MVERERQWGECGGGVSLLDCGRTNGSNRGFINDVVVGEKYWDVGDGRMWQKCSGIEH